MSLQKNLSGISSPDKPTINLEKKDVTAINLEKLFIDLEKKPVKTVNLEKSSIDLEKKKQIGSEMSSDEIAGYFDGEDAELFEQVKELASYRDRGLNVCINDVRTLRNIKQEVKDTMIGAAGRPMNDYSRNLLESQLNSTIDKYISNGDICSAKVDVNLSQSYGMAADVKLWMNPYTEYINLSFEVKD